MNSKHSRGAQNREPEISWRYCERMEAGEYRAYSRSYRVYRDGQFKRWVCAVQFDILDDSRTTVLGRLTWYLNLGSQEEPRAGRRGAYWSAWVKANNGQPRRKDRLSPSVFVKRYATVIVRDTVKDHRQMTVEGDNCYSVVRDVQYWETGGTPK